MRMIFMAAAMAALTGPAANAQAPALVGDYRLAAGPDVGGGLRIAADGSFEYGLVAGALDEFSSGRWEAEGDRICLITDPKPVAPRFEKADPIEVEGAIPTILATWPNGRGIAGIDFVIGFDSGDPIEDYTQSDGWTLPDGEKRVPRWVEVSEPVHDIVAPRFELGDADRGRLHVRLIPNDLGRVDLSGACLEARDAAVAILYRKEGQMRFVRSDPMDGD